MELKNKKFFTINLGCKVNLYETNCVINDLIAAHSSKTEDLITADICIVNTCSVTNNADKKSKYFINKAIRQKNIQLVVVMGCFSQINENYFKDYKKIIVIGNRHKNKIVDLIKSFKNEPIVKIDNIFKNKVFERFTNISFVENTRAFLKIQDGCNYMCSYCVIPFTRGPQISLDHNEIINEIKYLIKKNYKEIVLTGINTAGYEENSNYNFFHLLTDINKIPGDFRIRISSIEPFQINKELIDLIINNSKFVQHFHLCLQVANDKLLQLMNRKYTINEFKKLIQYIRSKNKLASITTDYIVGFNHETNEDFIKSTLILDQFKFSDIHIFPFSVRKFTAISRDDMSIDPKIIKQRFNKIYLLNKKNKTEYLKKFINKTVEVIFEKSKIKNIQSGHSNFWFKVYVKTTKNLHNQKICVKILKILDEKPFGELII